MFSGLLKKFHLSLFSKFILNEYFSVFFLGSFIQPILRSLQHTVVINALWAQPAVDICYSFAAKGKATSTPFTPSRRPGSLLHQALTPSPLARTLRTDVNGGKTPVGKSGARFEDSPRVFEENRSDLRGNNRTGGSDRNYGGYGVRAGGDSFHPGLQREFGGDDLMTVETRGNILIDSLKHIVLDL